MKALALSTTLMLALTAGSAHAVETTTSAQTRLNSTAETTIRNADGTWSTHSGISRTDPMAAEDERNASVRNRGTLSSDITGGALSGNIRSSSGVDTELDTRSTRAGVRVGTQGGVGSSSGSAGAGVGAGVSR